MDINSSKEPIDDLDNIDLFNTLVLLIIFTAEYLSFQDSRQNYYNLSFKGNKPFKKSSKLLTCINNWKRSTS